MVAYFSFDHQFEALIPTRDQREDADAPVIPVEGAIIVYTDGSSEPRGTGAGIFFNGLSADLSIPFINHLLYFTLLYASIFQAETYAILKFATVLDRGYM